MVPNDDPDLQNLVEQCLLRFEDEGNAAIEAACTAHPHLASALREQLKALHDMGLLQPPKEPAAAEIPEQLGDFRLLKKLGEGGMGVVYLAEQCSLKRQVALKLIRPEQLYFPRARERFRREVEAVARLSHPGIVPVYSVGEEHGVPYFAMAFVPGATLQDVIRAMNGRAPESLGGADLAAFLDAWQGRGGDASATPQVASLFRGNWVETSLQIALRVAEALEHAHAHDILHRDLKPSNVMLDRNGRVVLLDFGLAVQLGDSRITQTGLQVGSPLYMSPEQVRGVPDEVSVRSDVYAVGVVLYELLTLRSPFATSGEHLREHILRGDVDPLRNHNRAVPRDAETVCLTAMERDPERRYASAHDLARDLRSILEYRPIEARRPGPWLRARRTMQRHPSATAAAVLSFLLIVVAPATIAFLQHRAARQIATEQANTAHALAAQRETNLALEAAIVAKDEALQRATAATAHAEQESRRASGNFALARATVNQLLVFAAEAIMRDIPGMDQARKQLIKLALDYYDTFLAQEEQDGAVIIEMARNLTWLASLQAAIGERDEGYESLERARTYLDRVTPTAATESEYLRVKCALLTSFASHDQRDGDYDQAAELMLEALQYAEQLIDADPDDLANQQCLAFTYSNLLTIQGLRHDDDEALATAHEAMEFLEKLCAGEVSDQLLLERMAACFDRVAVVLQRQDQRDAALQACNRALHIVDLLLADNPSHSAVRELQLRFEDTKGLVLTEMHDLDHAEGVFRSALAHAMKLAAEYPDRLECRFSVGRDHRDLAMVLIENHRDAQGQQELEAAIASLDEVARRFAPEVRVLDCLGSAHHMMADLFVARRQFDRAQSELLAAKDVADRLTALSATMSADYLLSGVLSDMARVRSAVSQGPFDRSLEREAVRRACGYLTVRPSSRDGHNRLRDSYRLARDAFLSDRDHRSAVELTELSIAHGQGDTELLMEAARTLARCAHVVLDDTSSSEAERRAVSARYVTRGLDSLALMIKAGFTDRNRLASDPDLAVLRDDARFASMIETVAPRGE